MHTACDLRICRERTDLRVNARVHDRPLYVGDQCVHAARTFVPRKSLVTRERLLAYSLRIFGSSQMYVSAAVASLKVSENNKMTGAVGSDRFRSRAAASLETGAGDGGNMDDILKRLGVVEASVADIRAQVTAISAVLQHLATKAEIHSMEASIIKRIIGTTIATAALAFAIAKFAS